MTVLTAKGILFEASLLFAGLGNLARPAFAGAAGGGAAFGAGVGATGCAAGRLRRLRGDVEPAHRCRGAATGSRAGGRRAMAGRAVRRGAAVRGPPPGDGPIGNFVAVRSGEPTDLDTRGIEVVELRGLDLAAAAGGIGAAGMGGRRRLSKSCGGPLREIR